ncbi:MAG: zinc ribbon domain-containing protein [Chloroflexota bacterium]
MEETIARLFQFTAAISIAFVVALWFALIVWTYRDITRRSESAAVQIVSTLLAVLGWLPGVIVYLLMRPRETLEERYQREVEEAYLEQELNSRPMCPTCDAVVDREFQFCPNCGEILKHGCPNCGRLVELGWRVCAHCGERLGARTPPSERSRSSDEWEVNLNDPEVAQPEEAPAASRGFDWETAARSENRGGD